ncbi:hypothetical protein F0562_030018 [Nyssa sinensis]|uniref:Uncharacterized protein n=1 Tax=Nyssa sinensis TaxID=561372 RepID=A0A5J5AV38_9ASTE|nr:hypothetical protein F0562_030018 [Nyssa sinensis]
MNTSEDAMKKKAFSTLACLHCAAVSAALRLVSAAWTFFAVAALKIEIMKPMEMICYQRMEQLPVIGLLACC